MNKIFTLKFAGIKTGDTDIDALIEDENTKRAILDLKIKAEDFDDALEFANTFLKKIKCESPDTYIWGVEEFDPDDEENN